MFKIQTLNNLAPQGLERLPPDSYEVGPQVTPPDAYLVRSHKMHGMEIPDTVLAVARAGAGTNNIPCDELAKRGIVVFNTPGANANAVKELVIAGMIMAARNVRHGAAFVHELDGDHDEVSKAVEAGKKHFVGVEIFGRTLGIIGMGAIGRSVAETAVALGMTVITSSQKAHLPAGVSRVHDIDALCRTADVISVHVPMRPNTKGLISAERLALMKPDAMLLNFARAEIVDEPALIDALETDRLGAYVTDFPTPTVKDHRHVTALPHLGASTHEAEINCAHMATDELRRYLEDGTITHAVNYPALEVPRGPGARVCVLSSAEAAPRVIEALPGAHQAVGSSTAYTIADGADPSAVEGLDGVYRVRVL